MKNSRVLFPIISLVVFGVGFFSGMEYKAYQVRKKIDELTNELSKTFSSPTPNEELAEKTKTFTEKVNDNKEVIIQKSIGDLVELATINVKALSSEEKSIINLPFGEPEVASQGAKFVIVNLEVTNTTSAPFDYSSDNILLDQKDREFSSADIFSMENELTYEELLPSIKKQGTLVFQVADDATSYSLIYRKAGTNEVYKIILK